jgi:hypothetical protein
MRRPHPPTPPSQCAEERGKSWGETIITGTISRSSYESLVFKGPDAAGLIWAGRSLCLRVGWHRAPQPGIDPGVALGRSRRHREATARVITALGALSDGDSDQIAE